MITPHGGVLIDKTIPDAELSAWSSDHSAARIEISDQDLIHLVNLGTGAYSPLEGFMSRVQYRSVIAHNKLPQGDVWTIPILLHVSPETNIELSGPNQSAVLVNGKQKPVGRIDISSTFEVDLTEYAEAVFGTLDPQHPGVGPLLQRPSTCVGGQVRLPLRTIPGDRFYRRPAEFRDILEERAGTTFTAFSTRNIPHIGHEHQIKTALSSGGPVGINVITGAGLRGSFLPDVIFDVYEQLRSASYEDEALILNNLRLPPIFGGPREAVLQAIMLQNYGFDRFIVGRDHAGVGTFYYKYASQNLFAKLSGLKIKILPLKEPRYCRACNSVSISERCDKCEKQTSTINGRDIRRYLTDDSLDQLNGIVSPVVQRALLAKLAAVDGSPTGTVGPNISERLFYP